MKFEYMIKVMLLLSMLLFVYVGTVAAEPEKGRTLTEYESKKVEQLTGRLEQIRHINHSELTFEQKIALRSEVKSIKQQLRDIGGGVYISAAALIIIILLLILLL